MHFWWGPDIWMLAGPFSKSERNLYYLIHFWGFEFALIFDLICIPIILQVILSVGGWWATRVVSTKHPDWMERVRKRERKMLLDTWVSTGLVLKEEWVSLTKCHYYQANGISHFACTRAGLAKTKNEKPDQFWTDLSVQKVRFRFCCTVTHVSFTVPTDTHV